MNEIMNYFTMKLHHSGNIHKTKTYFTLFATVILALIPHVILAIYFFRIQIFVMALINVLSCIVYCCNFILNKMGKPRLVSIITTVDIIIYSILSVFFIGLDVGSQWLILTVLIPQFILFDVSERQRMVLLLLAFVALNFCIFINSFYPPIFSQEGNVFLKSFHVNVVFIIIILELTFNTLLNKIISNSNTTKIEQYKELAHVDPLTQLKNRRYAQIYFDDMLNNGLSNNIYCFALLDIDHFKIINDTYGHDMGDKILRILSQRLMGSFRQGDLIARWGGEEFLLVIKDCDIQKAKIILENLRVKIENDFCELSETDPMKVNFTVTIGAAQLNGLSIDRIIKQCDNNLYKGKNNGRNQVVI